MLALPPRRIEGGIVPFLIDWGDTQSPARVAPRGCSLGELVGGDHDPSLQRRGVEPPQIPTIIIGKKIAEIAVRKPSNLRWRRRRKLASINRFDGELLAGPTGLALGKSERDKN